MRSIVVVCAFVFAAAPAAAQSTYVGASLLGEFSRFGGFDYDDDAARIAPARTSRDGETVGFDLKIGRAISERWGVELAFGRGGVNEHRQTIDILGSLSIATTTPGSPFPVPRVPPVNPILPIPEYAIEIEEQYTTIATSAWVRQELGDRVALVFSGGISFNRVESEQRTNIDVRRLANTGGNIEHIYSSGLSSQVIFGIPTALSLYAPFPTSVETIDYGVGPVVGTEAIVGVGEHAALTGGVRLHGVSGGWLIRPSVGLRWSF